MKIHLILTSFLIILFSCKKSDQNFENETLNNGSFFSSKSEAKEKLKVELDRRNSNEKLLDIQSISYINSDSARYAIIFYSTNTGSHNILYEKSNHPSETEQFRITTCDGFDCACKVNVTIDNHGKVIVNCTCTSCLIITTQ